MASIVLRAPAINQMPDQMMAAPIKNFRIGCCSPRKVR
jgi:hypothetical protein